MTLSQESKREGECREKGDKTEKKKKKKKKKRKKKSGTSFRERGASGESQRGLYSPITPKWRPLTTGIV